LETLSLLSPVCGLWCNFFWNPAGFPATRKYPCLFQVDLCCDWDCCSKLLEDQNGVENQGFHFHGIFNHISLQVGNLLLKVIISPCFRQN